MVMYGGLCDGTLVVMLCCLTHLFEGCCKAMHFSMLSCLCVAFSLVAMVILS